MDKNYPKSFGAIDYPAGVAKEFPKVKPSLILAGFGLQALGPG